jgi:ribose transport system permease protein
VRRRKSAPSHPATTYRHGVTAIRAEDDTTKSESSVTFPETSLSKSLPRQRRRLSFRGHPFAWVWFAIIGLLVLTLIIAPRLARPATLLNELTVASFLAIAGIGQTMVIMARGFDMSSPGIVTLAAFIIAQHGYSPARLPAAIAMALGFSLLVGLVNGALVSLVRINSIIATLATSALALGAAFIYAHGFPTKPAASQFHHFMYTKALGIPLPVYLAMALTVICTVVLRYTLLGRRFIFFSANPRAARAIGLPVKVYEMAVYSLSGILFGVAGILVAGFVSWPSQTVGDSYLLGTIAATVVGGTALTGGMGSFVATFAGAFFLTHLDQLVLGVHLSAGWQDLATAVIIALSLAIRRSPEAARS